MRADACPGLLLLPMQRNQHFTTTWELIVICTFNRSDVTRLLLQPTSAALSLSNLYAVVEFSVAVWFPLIITSHPLWYWRPIYTYPIYGLHMLKLTLSKDIIVIRRKLCSATLTKLVDKKKYNHCYSKYWYKKYKYIHISFGSRNQTGL